MRIVHSSIALCTVAFIGCSMHASVNPEPLPPPLQVVSGVTPPAMIDPRLVNFPDSWTPTEADVTLADPKVQACVVSHRERLRSTLSNFVRHYSGWTIDGRRTLRVQFYDTRHFRAEELTHSSEVVDGDGETYFVVKFDLESGMCSF